MTQNSSAGAPEQLRSGAIVTGILLIVGGAIAVVLVAPALIVLGVVIKGLVFLALLGALGIVLGIVLIVVGIRTLVRRPRA